MLEKNHSLEYVPVLHANTSSLESHFSLMKWYDSDTPSKYDSTFNIADNEKSMKQLERNPMYPTNSEVYIEHTILTGHKFNEKMLKIYKHEKLIDYDIFIDAFIIEQGCKNLRTLGGICPEIQKAVIYKPGQVEYWL